jgi:para-aminobenzoate synthetase component 1
MEIIDELEPETRSVYCGSMIMIEPDGRLDSSIAIRTLIQKKGRLVLQVGGGIVHDSDEQDEYEESWHKAQGIIGTLR